MLGETGLMNNNVSIKENEMIFEDNFDTEQLSRIIKVASLSSSMNIFCRPDYPMYIHTKIGLIGNICLYLKSKAQIEAETSHERLLPSPSLSATPPPSTTTSGSAITMSNDL
jgi:hypothetical protein